MITRNAKLLIPLLLILLAAISGCQLLNSENEESLEASGVIETVEVIVSPELVGRVAEVFVEEGDNVEIGQVLFTLEGELINAQREQAIATLDMAHAQLKTAQTSLEVAHAALATAEANANIARIQYDLELDNARFLDRPGRIQAWEQDIPKEFSLPVWYFQKEEQIAAAESEVEAAREAFEIEQTNYQSTLEEAGHADLREAEERLVKAQAAFMIADELLDRRINREGKEELEDHLEVLFQAAEDELEAAQSAYEKVFSEQSAADVLDARARLAVARSRYETALDQLNALFTGDYSKTVIAAEGVVQQAETAVDQANINIALAESEVVQGEKTVAQTQAALKLIELQIKKLSIPAAVSGVVMTRNVEPGEVIQPGTPAFTIGQLDQLTIKVYIPETLYGQINLGDQASISADSFPGQIFNGTVIRIADRAEYTPRNVQTKEDRQTTVFEVELILDDHQGKLKPGMPADVIFQ